MRRHFFFFLLVAGLTVILYPFAKELLLTQRQVALVLSLEEDPSQQVADQYEDLQSVFQSEAEEGPGSPAAIPTKSHDQRVDLDLTREIEREKSEQLRAGSGDVGASSESDRPIALLRIDRIDLKLPVLYDATDDHLDLGAAQILGTATLGTVGNAVIAGHRSYTYGRNFNRLDEVKVGDQLVIEKDGRTYRYTVYKKHVVEPNDTSVLNQTKDHKVLTLITCTPIRVATHRLVVHACVVAEDASPLP